MDEEREAAPVMRQAVAASIHAERDRLGRKQPHNYGIPALAGIWGRLGIPVDKVPGEFVAVGVSNDGVTIAEISCPCKNVAVVEAGGFAACRPDQDFDLDADQLQCPRFFAFTGQDVYVIGSQRTTRDLPTAAAS